MATQAEAVLEAFKSLNKVLTAEVVRQWMEQQYTEKWSDCSTILADMVSPYHNGNNSSTVPLYLRRVLERVERGKYRLLK